MEGVKWSIKGPHFANCNCDYGCPCQFNALPTDGTCRAVVGWRIDTGHYGDVNLDGFYAIATYGWPGAVHQGDGEMQVIIDERANEAQRKALNTIMLGEGADAGSSMLVIYRAMCTKVHETLFSPIQMEIDMESRTAQLTVPGLIETTIEPIVNPVTGAQHRARIDLPMGKEFFLAEVASGKTKGSGAVDLDFDKTHAHIACNETTSNGPAI